MANGNLFLNSSNGGKLHVYREWHDQCNNRTLYIARCSCPGVNNGHTQVRGRLIPLDVELNYPGVCASGKRLIEELRQPRPYEAE